MAEIEKFIAKITKVGDSHGIIIPAHILKYKGIEKGMIMNVTIERADQPSREQFRVPNQAIGKALKAKREAKTEVIPASLIDRAFGDHSFMESFELEVEGGLAFDVL